MSEKNTGGQAGETLTLRDYFAAKALQGICASAGNIAGMSSVTHDCYRIADAMLKAKEA